MDRFWESLLKTLGSKVLDGLWNLRRSSSVRLALGAGVVGLRCCQMKNLETEIVVYLQRWAERSRPPWEHSAVQHRGLNDMLEMVVEKEGEVKPTLGATGGVRLSSSRHVDCGLVGWVGSLIEECSS
jgi:hypothetical protein